MAKRPKGMSAREYAAQQSGGTLNYKTGKISTPVTTPKATSTKISSPNYSAPQGDPNTVTVNGQGFSVRPDLQESFVQSKTAQNPFMPAQQENNLTKALNAGKSNSSNKSSKNSSPTVVSQPTSTRSLAKTAFDNTFGTPKAQASTGAPKPITGSVYTPTVSKATGMFGDLFQNAIQPVKGMYTNLTHGSGLPDFGVSELLGLTKQESGGLSYNPGDTPAVDPATGQNVNPSFPSSPYFDAYTNTGEKNLSAPIWHAPTSQNSIDNSRPQTTPRQVSQPWQAPLTSISGPTSWFTPQEQQQYNAPQQDFNMPQRQQESTRRMSFGNGSTMSNGAYNNGQGNYGVQGAMTGTGQDLGGNTIDDLLTLLGIKPQTAQAAETQNFAPQDMGQSSFAPNSFNSSAFGQAIQPNIVSPTPQTDFNKNGWSATNTPTDDPGYQSPRVSNPGGSQGGGVAQQYAQPQSQTLDLMQQQTKGFSAQEKAQKRATDELIRSIRDQYQSQIDQTNKTYDTQQTQGASDLEKAKQADLLKLSGLFNFSANQSPDSEQRIQYEQRAQDQSNTALKDFLAKIIAARGTDITNLQSGQSKDISGAKQQLQQALAGIADKRNASQLDIAKMVDDLKNKALDRASKGGGSTSAGSVTYMGDNADGNPVYRNSKTGQLEVGTGLTRKAIDPFTAYLQGQGQNQSQGGTWETDPQTGEKIWVTN